MNGDAGNAAKHVRLSRLVDERQQPLWKAKGRHRRLVHLCLNQIDKATCDACIDPRDYRPRP
jgi:hypothetical protein